MKKQVLSILLVFLMLCSMFILAACDGFTDPTTDENDEVYKEIYDLYVDYAASNGNTPDSYEDWLDSIRGENGKDGKDGLTPTIGKNGNWWIGNVDTGVPALPKNGVDGENGKDGADGKDGVGIVKIEKISSEGLVDTYEITYTTGTKFTFTITNGANGTDGKDGVDGNTPLLRITDGYWEASYDNGATWISLGVKASGEKGDKGDPGKDGKDGIGILDTEINENGELVITLTDGTVLDPIALPKNEEHHHTESDWIVLKDASCTENGLKYQECSTCSSIIDLEIINRTLHSSSEWIIIKEATEYEDGIKQKICTTCKEVMDEEVITFVHTLSLSYDDYIDVTNQTVTVIESCALSGNSNDAVVTLNNNYLVATNIGTAKIKINERLYAVTVKKAKINIVMIMGQSNAGNHFANATSDVTCPIGTAYWWGNGLGTAANEPVLYTSPSMGFHTPLLAELYAQSETAGDPTKNVMIWHEGITSKNGQSISKWASSATDTNGTDNAVIMLEKCLLYYRDNDDKFEIVKCGVYWLQGEADTSMDPKLYTERFQAMWQRLKDAGMEYLAFLRLRRGTKDKSPISDDLYYSASLSAQIQMVNENSDFFMATTITENWIGAASSSHTVDISSYITMVETYGQSSTYTDKYGNDATYHDGKLTTFMKSLYGSNNVCHYGKFGYGVIGADAAYNMYRALNYNDVSFVVTDTSGYADRQSLVSKDESIIIDIAKMTDNISIRPACGSTAGTLRFTILSENTDITNNDNIIVKTGDLYGSININELKHYDNVSIIITYTTAYGDAYTSVCKITDSAENTQIDYVWDFNTDLYARDENGNIVNAFSTEALSGGYTLENGCLIGTNLQLAIENTIELYAEKNWSIEWKYGELNGGVAGFLLCSNKDNAIGNKGIYHIKAGENIAICNYVDATGYRNYTSSNMKIKDGDCVRITNTYSQESQKSTLSLWINNELIISDFQLKGSINSYNDKTDMTQHPLNADFSFNYIGNIGRTDWLLNCQLDYLKISFGD